MIFTKKASDDIFIWALYQCGGTEDIGENAFGKFCEPKSCDTCFYGNFQVSSSKEDCVYLANSTFLLLWEYNNED